MIGVIAILKIKEDSVETFETGFKDLQSKVRANEPGNVAYQLTKSRTEPHTYKVLEIYKDQAALEAHRLHLNTATLIAAWRWRGLAESNQVIHELLAMPIVFCVIGDTE